MCVSQVKRCDGAAEARCHSRWWTKSTSDAGMSQTSQVSLSSSSPCGGVSERDGLTLNDVFTHNALCRSPLPAFGVCVSVCIGGCVLCFEDNTQEAPDLLMSVVR